MKVNVVCVGKIKEKYFTDAINEYAKEFQGLRSSRLSSARNSP